MNSSRNVKTYSRRNSLKTPAKRAPDVDDDNSNDERPAKRQAVGGPSTPNRNKSPYRLGESSRTRLEAGDEDGVVTDVDDDEEGENVRGSTPTRNNGARGGDLKEKNSASSVTSTPSKLPQNLSNLFDDVFSSSPSPSKLLSPSRSQGKTSRMLGRSKTESSIESSPSKASSSSFGTRSQSFATPTKKSARTPSKSNSQTRSDATPTNDRDDAQPRHTVSSASRTYAGQSRSFLVAVPVSSLPNRLGKQVADFAANDEEEFRDSYSDLRKRWGIDNSENDSYNDADPSGSQTPNEENLNNVLFSITDLRSKGESRRFIDEAGYLFDGFDPSGSLSVWRSAATDLVINLIKPDFFKNAKAADFLGKIWVLLRGVGAGDGDKVLDTVLSCFIALLKIDSRDITSLSAMHDFAPTCRKLLDSCQDGDLLGSLEILSNFELSQMGIKRPEKLMLQRLRTSLSHSDAILPAGCEPSIRYLVSSICATVPRKFYQHIGAILESLNRELSSLTRRISAFMSGLPLLPEHDWNHEQLCLEHASNCLHILDTYLVDLQYGNALEEDDWSPEGPDVVLSERLIALITFVNALEMAGPVSFVSLSVAARCSELAFRVLINLTNGNKAWCKLVSRNTSLVPQLVRSIMGFLQSSSDPKRDKLRQKDDQTAPFDRLCLALGVLTNVNHEEKLLTRQLRKTRYKPTCSKSACLNGCNCPDANNGFFCLCTVYSSLRNIEDAYTVSEIQYVMGHLALLLGLLCNSTSDCLDMLAYLPGSTNENKLQHLMETIQDFSTAYRTFSRHLNGESNGHDTGEEHQGAISAEVKVEDMPSSSPIAAQVSQMTSDVLQSLHRFQREMLD